MHKYLPPRPPPPSPQPPSIIQVRCTRTCRELSPSELPFGGPFRGDVRDACREIDRLKAELNRRDAKIDGLERALDLAAGDFAKLSYPSPWRVVGLMTFLGCVLFLLVFLLAMLR